MYVFFLPCHLEHQGLFNNSSLFFNLFGGYQVRVKLLNWRRWKMSVSLSKTLTFRP